VSFSCHPRVTPFSSLQDPARVPEASVDADRFLPDDPGVIAGDSGGLL